MADVRKPTTLPLEADALPGRSNPIPTSDRHAVSGRPIKPPFPDRIETAMFGLGRFWGAERMFWALDGVYSTAAGYAGGVTPNPTYAEVQTGRTGHNQVVLVAFDPRVIAYPELVSRFFEAHDPTQGMRQGDDVGTQFRSAIYGSEGQLAQARGVKTAYALALKAAGFGPVTTETLAVPMFYYAEADHQQYLARHPDDDRGPAGTGVRCPIRRRAADAA